MKSQHVNRVAAKSVDSLLRAVAHYRNAAFSEKCLKYHNNVTNLIHFYFHNHFIVS
jgi:hypothetical protein